MPYELLLAVFVIGGLSFLAYLGGRQLGVTNAQNHRWLLAEALCFTMLFAWTLADRLLWAQAIPVSDVVCWANLTPVFVAFTAGLATRAHGLGPVTRPLAVSALCLLAMTHLVQPIARPILWPITSFSEPRWDRGVCLQTHPSSCAAAAAVTLLSSQNIVISEVEMADWCLTSNHGTTPLGLYRGIATASQGQEVSASVASRDPSQWTAKHQLPNVSLVRFSHKESGQVKRFLGPRSEGHAVVVWGRENGAWLIGDPAVGLTRWSDEEFQHRFVGDAVYLRQ